MRWGWSRAKFETGRQQKDKDKTEDKKEDDDSDDDYSKRRLNLYVVDGAVHNISFWGWLHMFKFLGIVILRLFLWLSSCPCHFA